MSEIRLANGINIDEIVKAVVMLIQPQLQATPEPGQYRSNEFDEYPEVLQAKHVRKILGLSEAKTYEVLNSKKCPSFTVGKRKLVRKEAFIAFLEASDNQDLID